MASVMLIFRQFDVEAPNTVWGKVLFVIGQSDAPLQLTKFQSRGGVRAPPQQPH